MLYSRSCNVRKDRTNKKSRTEIPMDGALTV